MSKKINMFGLRYKILHEDRASAFLIPVKVKRFLSAFNINDNDMAGLISKYIADNDCVSAVELILFFEQGRIQIRFLNSDQLIICEYNRWVRISSSGDIPPALLLKYNKDLDAQELEENGI